ncbi:MAG: 4a-hydroxytetrahydrobiopterin dehydratase [Gemmatimonadetes bacterium]|nr:4a-hydroxytetrahydrobiopterin dehydratase [Gemmatimonadota bacterium]
MTRPTLLTDAELEARLIALPAWRRTGNTITRTITFAGFPEAVAFVTRLVEPAEAMQHHPDIDVRYNRVVITLSTHDAGGLTASDVTLAARIDALVG